MDAPATSTDDSVTTDASVKSGQHDALRALHFLCLNNVANTDRFAAAGGSSLVVEVITRALARTVPRPTTHVAPPGVPHACVLLCELASRESASDQEILDAVDHLLRVFEAWPTPSESLAAAAWSLGRLFSLTVSTLIYEFQPSPMKPCWEAGVKRGIPVIYGALEVLRKQAPGTPCSSPLNDQDRRSLAKHLLDLLAILAPHMEAREMVAVVPAQAAAAATLKNNQDQDQDKHTGHASTTAAPSVITMDRLCRNSWCFCASLSYLWMEVVSCLAAYFLLTNPRTLKCRWCALTMLATAFPVVKDMLQLARYKHPVPVKESFALHTYCLGAMGLLLRRMEGTDECAYCALHRGRGKGPEQDTPTEEGKESSSSTAEPLVSAATAAQAAVAAGETPSGVPDSPFDVSPYWPSLHEASDYTMMYVGADSRGEEDFDFACDPGLGSSLEGDLPDAPAQDDLSAGCCKYSLYCFHVHEPIKTPEVLAAVETMTTGLQRSVLHPLPQNEVSTNHQHLHEKETPGGVKEMKKGANSATTKTHSAGQLNVCWGTEDMTLLHRVAASGLATAVLVVLNKAGPGLDPLRRARSGANALQLARDNRHSAVVALLEDITQRAARDAEEALLRELEDGQGEEGAAAAAAAAKKKAKKARQKAVKAAADAKEKEGHVKGEMLPETPEVPDKSSHEMTTVVATSISPLTKVMTTTEADREREYERALKARRDQLEAERQAREREAILAREAREAQEKKEQIRRAELQAAEREKGEREEKERLARMLEKEKREKEEKKRREMNEEKRRVAKEAKREKEMEKQREKLELEQRDKEKQKETKEKEKDPAKGTTPAPWAVVAGQQGTATNTNTEYHHHNNTAVPTSSTNGVASWHASGPSGPGAGEWSTTGNAATWSSSDQHTYGGPAPSGGPHGPPLPILQPQPLNQNAVHQHPPYAQHEYQHQHQFGPPMSHGLPMMLHQHPMHPHPPHHTHQYGPPLMDHGSHPHPRALDFMDTSGMALAPNASRVPGMLDPGVEEGPGLVVGLSSMDPGGKSDGNESIREGDQADAEASRTRNHDHIHHDHDHDHGGATNVPAADLEAMLAGLLLEGLALESESGEQGLGSGSGSGTGAGNTGAGAGMGKVHTLGPRPSTAATAVPNVGHKHGHGHGHGPNPMSPGDLWSDTGDGHSQLWAGLDDLLAREAGAALGGPGLFGGLGAGDDRGFGEALGGVLGELAGVESTSQIPTPLDGARNVNADTTGGAHGGPTATAVEREGNDRDHGTNGQGGNNGGGGSRDRDRGKRNQSSDRDDRAASDVTPSSADVDGDGDYGDGGGRFLWLGNLKYNVHKSALWAAFEPYGKVQDVVTFTGRQFAFVNFALLEEARQATAALAGRVVATITGDRPLIIKPRSGRHKLGPMVLTDSGAAAGGVGNGAGGGETNPNTSNMEADPHLSPSDNMHELGGLFSNPDMIWGSRMNSVTRGLGME